MLVDMLQQRYHLTFILMGVAKVCLVNAAAPDETPVVRVADCGADGGVAVYILWVKNQKYCSDWLEYLSKIQVTSEATKDYCLI